MAMKEWIRNNQQSIIVAAILVVLLSYSFHTFFIKRRDKLYTIGVVERIYKPANGGFRASYVYRVNGVSHTQSTYVGHFRNKVTPNARYMVEYPNGYESRGIMLFEYPIPHSLDVPLGIVWDDKPSF